ncbi:MAG: type II toxin-antitoxin system Phd/YefM family antitoxin [Armatimonadetes bacterium]|nr:type II toxin-antitoxin system Phd/YefM family antitoxin [Armatimonadota bacterium]
MKVDQVMSATYVRRHLEAVVRRVEKTGERILVTRYGRPAMVMEPVDANGQPSSPRSLEHTAGLRLPRG